MLCLDLFELQLKTWNVVTEIGGLRQLKRIFQTRLVQLSPGIRSYSNQIMKVRRVKTVLKLASFNLLISE